MSDLRELLGDDDYEATIDKAVQTAERYFITANLLAQAWDEGHRIGLMQADYEYGHRLTMPNLTNPYREEARDA